MTLDKASGQQNPKWRVYRLGHISFRVRLFLVWSFLLSALFVLLLHLDLRFFLIYEKLPYIAGFQLTADGFVQGAALTILLCLISMILSSILGFITAFGRLSSSAIWFGVATFYMSLFRGTPLLVQIFVIYVGLPQLGPVPGALTSGIAALSLNYGAYLGEIVRSGIIAVPRGQREAATALGLNSTIIMLKIVLPQAMRIILPPMTSQFIAMLKDSALVSIIGVSEIMFLAQSYGRASYRYFEMLLTAAIIYWILSLTLEILQSRLERRFGRGIDTRPSHTHVPGRKERLLSDAAHISIRPENHTAKDDARGR